MASASLTSYAGCSCASSQQQMQQDGAGGWRCVAAAAAAGWGLGPEKAGYIAGLVVLAVVPQLLVALGLYLFIR